MGTQEFMSEITVTMFDIYKIEARLMGHSSRAMKLLNDLLDLLVCKQRVVVGDAKSLV